MSIGVFDSGIGGLTVYKAIANSFPKLNMFYLGDSARVPYGNKSREAIIRYSVECSKYLASKHNISALIVACNTVSSHALGELERVLKIPVLGVIQPGAKNAVDVTKNKNVAMLATHATVNSCAYKFAIDKLAKDINLFQLACPLFVPLVEESLINGDMVKAVVQETLKPVLNKDIDTIILGCTHYPVLMPIIKEVMPNCNIVDSTKYIIGDIKMLNQNLDEEGVRKIYITDESQTFQSLKNMLVGDIKTEKILL